MARTPSNMLPLGTIAPHFSLQEAVTKKTVSSDSFSVKHGLIVVFICNHCPFVKHIIEELVRICNDYRVQGFDFVAINSNDVNQYPQDSPEKMEAFAEAYSFPFPYLFDSTQEVAKAYDAACTPDFFVFDNSRKLVYRGQMDDSRPGNSIPVSGRDLREALDNILRNRPQNSTQLPGLGCNIKWKS